MVKSLNWNITPDQFPRNGPASEKLAFLCNFGAMAPSIHNVQPWQFKVSGNTMEVSINADRVLKDGDPTGRETWVSMGCCVENLVQAAAFFGFEIKLRSAQYGFPTGSVTLSLSTKDGPPLEWDVLSAIKKRRTDRSKYSAQPLEKREVEKIENAWSSDGVMLVVTSQPQVTATVAELTSRGIGMALRFPGFRNELASLIRPLKNRADGITTEALELGKVRGLLEPSLVRQGIGIERQAKKELELMRSAAGVALVFARGDAAKFWLEAGRAIQKAALVATDLGLSTATTAAAVEAADFHEDIEKLIGTSFRLQAVMRIGHGRQRRRHSPRLALTELLTSN